MAIETRCPKCGSAKSTTVGPYQRCDGCGVTYAADAGPDGGGTMKSMIKPDVVEALVKLVVSKASATQRAEHLLEHCVSARTLQGIAREDAYDMVCHSPSGAALWEKHRRRAAVSA